MTKASPNIMIFWHNILHDITGWMQEKLELMNRNGQGDDFLKFIKGKHGFYNGENGKILNPIFGQKNWPILVQSIPEDTE